MMLVNAEKTSFEYPAMHVSLVLGVRELHSFGPAVFEDSRNHLMDRYQKKRETFSRNPGRTWSDKGDISSTNCRTVVEAPECHAPYWSVIIEKNVRLVPSNVFLPIPKHYAVMFVPANSNRAGAPAFVAPDRNLAKWLP
jgi:hypothetical protein